MHALAALGLYGRVGAILRDRSCDRVVERIIFVGVVGLFFLFLLGLGDASVAGGGRARHC